MPPSLCLQLLGFEWEWQLLFLFKISSLVEQFFLFLKKKKNVDIDISFSLVFWYRKEWAIGFLVQSQVFYISIQLKCDSFYVFVVKCTFHPSWLIRTKSEGVGCFPVSQFLTVSQLDTCLHLLSCLFAICSIVPIVFYSNQNKKSFAS